MASSAMETDGGTGLSPEEADILLQSNDKRGDTDNRTEFYGRSVWERPSGRDIFNHNPPTFYDGDGEDESDIANFIQIAEAWRGTEVAPDAIEIPVEEFIHLWRPWRRAVIIKVLGKNVAFPVLHQNLHSMWCTSGGLDILDLEMGYYVVRFGCQEDYETALTKGPWLMQGHYLVVFQWRPFFQPSKQKILSTLTWVRFPGIPHEFLNKEDFLRKLANCVGKLVRIDTFTQGSARARYARACVEINLQQVLRDSVVLNGNKFQVEYENMQNICFECRRFGHKTQVCPNLQNDTTQGQNSAGQGCSEGLVGEYLRETGELKTIADVVQEAVQGRSQVVAELSYESDLRIENSEQLQTKYNEKNMSSLDRMLEEKDLLHRNFCEETSKLQHQEREHVRRVLYEQEMLNMELENKGKLLDLWSRELNKREALAKLETQKLEEEKKKNDMRKLASEEQRKANQNVLRLVEEQKREKEEALKKIVDLERDLNVKQKLEMEMVELRGNLEVMKHLGNDEAVQYKIKEINENLKEKIEEMNYLEELSSILLTKELQSSDELQDARKELVMFQGLGELLSGSRTHIGIKRMGEIDKKLFDTACKQKFPNDSEFNFKAATACSLWQEKLKDANWYPFKVVMISESNHEKILDENDESLQELKSEWGDEVYAGVTEALKDLDEYNSSGRYPVPKLWNFKQNRKATLKEAISVIFKQLKSLKRKRQYEIEVHFRSY